MRTIIILSLPVIGMLSFLVSWYQYIKLSSAPPKKNASEFLKLSTVVCVISGIMSGILSEEVAESYRTKTLIGYKSRLVVMDAGTEDSHSYYQYSSRDQRHNEISDFFYYAVIAVSIALPVLSFRWMNEITKLEDWEFNYIADYKKRLKAKEEQRIWYDKHPKRIRPLDY